MQRMARSTGSICFFVPGRVLRKLAEKATVQEREALLDSAILSEHIRGQRSVRSFLAAVTPAGEKRRTIYDARHGQRLPGQLVRGEEGANSNDETVNQAFESAGATYDFYMETLGRNSIDGRGLRLDSTVHFGKNFNNAFWNGAQMVYGDGDRKLFLGFAGAIDVVAHELTHGVTQYTVPGGGLIYEGQSGALNESFSDVFGSLVKQWKRGDDAESADWLIGEGILAPAYGKALRSMKAPGTAWQYDDQPKDMTAYVPEGDVHVNSGIPNHAFYLAAIGIGGKSWERAGKIWYRALSALQPSSDFHGAAQATIESAKLLFGSGSREQKAVEEAWRAVKVLT
jgi:Zn-dependent metalloprotease